MATGFARASQALSLTVRLAALVAAVRALPACAPLPPPQPFSGALGAIDSSRSGRVAVIADLQRTSRLEFWRESNDAERAALVRGLADAWPDALFLAGDLVFDGGSARQWADFDALMAPVRDAGIPAFAVPGNHEYWLGQAGDRHLFARFPHLGGRHHYEVDHGPLRLVLLDSNISALTAEAWAAQRRWYEEALRRADADRAVKGVVVLLHHPPYTNSTVTGDELHVRRDLVPPLLASRKALAMISGHVHSYERFLRHGKMFIVSGGGGGPRAALATGRDRRHTDDLVCGPALRPFHFLLLQPAPEGVEVEVRGLQKGEREVGPIDAFRLPWPGPGDAAGSARGQRAR